MKTISALAFAAIAFAACNNPDNATVQTKDSTTNTTTTSATTYKPVDGDVTLKGNKVMVMTGGEWVEASQDITLDNGVVIYRTGKVKKADREIFLKGDEVVNSTGNFFDKSGQAIENAWDATKDGIKDAGKDVGNAAERAGKKVNDILSDDTSRH